MPQACSGPSGISVRCPQDGVTAQRVEAFALSRRLSHGKTKARSASPDCGSHQTSADETRPSYEGFWNETAGADDSESSSHHCCNPSQGERPDSRVGFDSLVTLAKPDGIAERRGVKMSNAATLMVWIDQDLGTGDGICEEITPDVFVGRDDGLWVVKEEEKRLGRTVVFDGEDGEGHGPDGARGLARVRTT